MRVWWLVLFAALPVREAAACIYPSNDPFVPNASTELVPPGPVTIESAAILRDGGPCVLPILHVHAAAVDDVTPTNQLGFRVRVVDGPRPATLSTRDPSTDRRSIDGVVYFHATVDGGGADFLLGVSAIDLSGNVGPESTTRVTYNLDEGGCSSTNSDGLALGTLAFFLRRRRRR